MWCFIGMEMPFLRLPIHPKDTLPPVNEGKIERAGQFAEKDLNE